MLNRVRVIDNGEPLVDLREAAPSVRVPRPQAIPFCRATVARMAEDVAQRLPASVYLAVTEAWRPMRRQRLIYDWLLSCAREAFPERSWPQLRRTVCRWVAPVDQKAPPGHCTGAALDVNLVDDHGEPLDVASPHERFEAAATWTAGLSETALRNRMLLVETMLGAGFSNCRHEWWHYSWGDAGWAVRVGEPACVYGLIEMPPASYAEQQRLWEEAFAERTNPFLPKAPQ